MEMVLSSLFQLTFLGLGANSCTTSETDTVNAVWQQLLLMETWQQDKKKKKQKTFAPGKQSHA